MAAIDDEEFGSRTFDQTLLRESSCWHFLGLNCLMAG
jgi:hypothetical protein